MLKTQRTLIKITPHIFPIFFPKLGKKPIFENKKRANFSQKSLKFARIWLGRSDLNTRMTESESVALPLGDAPIFNLRTTQGFVTECERFLSVAAERYPVNA